MWLGTDLEMPQMYGKLRLQAWMKISKWSLGEKHASLTGNDRYRFGTLR
jgi:hypothetical protein